MIRVVLRMTIFATGSSRGPFRGGSAHVGFTAALVAGALSGCVMPTNPNMRRELAVEAAARPLLEMHPDANWTECYNRLVEFGPASVDYVASRPIMHRTAAPDDLRVMLHTSLLRLLANPAAAPRLSVTCFETTLDVLHFDPKVRGRRLGDVRLPTTRLPAAWHDLYPADFDHALAAEIDAEADRRAALRWYEAQRGEPALLLTQRRLAPRAEYLWAVLPRRYADVWTYELKPDVFLCRSPPAGAALLRGNTYDYNLVRAACLWLASAEASGVQRELIELVAHPSPIVAYNARFALQHSPDPRIREVLERYNDAVNPAAPMTPYDSVGIDLLRRRGAARAPLSPGSCDEQGSATHEMDQVHVSLCGRDRHGNLHRREVRQHRGSPAASPG
jgi:hypothetical protein